METNLSKSLFLRDLAANHRVILLGGMAVIAHGLSRQTKDFDVWLEPMASEEEWAAKLADVCGRFPESYFWSLAEQRRLEAHEVAAEAVDFGVVRVGGFALPVDIFRKPNELEVDDFERVWAGATRMEGGVALPSETDLYMTKANTGREHDWQDQLFLEGLVKKRFRERLPVCDEAEARSLLDRFLDPEVLCFALDNPHAEVRDFALQSLREFEAEGDPYSRDILAEWRRKQA